MMKKKKYLLIGLMAFFLIAIISTTFATFIITGGTKEASTDSGNIEVGDVQSKIVNVSVELTDSTVKFDAEEEDSAGDVQASPDTQGDYEAEVMITVEGTEWTSVDITVSIFDSSNIEVKEQSLIALPTANLEKSKFSTTDNNTYTITTKLTFDWGSTFGGANPSTWLDSEDQKETYPTPQSKESALNEWLNTLNSYTFKVNVAINE